VVKSPQTNEPLSHLRLVPDTDLRRKIKDAISVLRLAKSAHHKLKETGGSRSLPSHYAIEPHGVTEEEVEGMRQELTVSNTFSIPSRQAASRDLPPAVTSMPPWELGTIKRWSSSPSERASYAAAPYSTALAFPSSRCMITADMSVGPKSNAATIAVHATQRRNPFALVDVPARVDRPMIIRVEVVKEVVREVSAPAQHASTSSCAETTTHKHPHVHKHAHAACAHTTLAGMRSG
jgi:hypothetical protein